METTYNYNRFTGQAPDPSGGTDPFSALVAGQTYFFTHPDGSGAGTKILQIWARDQNMLIRFSFTSAVLNWGDPIQIWDAPQSQDFYHSAQAFQVVNVVAGATATYQVVGLW